MNRARPMAARLTKKVRVNLEPRSAHGRAVNKPRVDYEPRSAHGRAVNNETSYHLSRTCLKLTCHNRIKADSDTASAIGR